jgi:hypothetical protein
MTKWKRTKRQIMLCKILKKKLKIEQHEPNIQPRLWEKCLVFCVVLLYVFTFWFLCCDVYYDFLIKTMFGSSLPQAVCSRAHVFFVLFVFACKLFKAKIGATQTPINNRKWTQVFFIRRHCDFHHAIILASFLFSSIMNFQELLMFILLFTCTPINSCSSE